MRRTGRRAEHSRLCFAVDEPASSAHRVLRIRASRRRLRKKSTPITPASLAVCSVHAGRVPWAFRSWVSRRCIDRDRDQAGLQAPSRPATAPRSLACGLSGLKADDWRAGTSAPGLNPRIDRAHRRSALAHGASKRAFGQQSDATTREPAIFEPGARSRRSAPAQC